MRSMWIENAIENLNGIIVLVLQLGFIVILVALVIMVLAAFVKAVTKRDKKEKEGKELLKVQDLFLFLLKIIKVSDEPPCPNFVKHCKSMFI